MAPLLARQPAPQADPRPPRRRPSKVGPDDAAADLPRPTTGSPRGCTNLQLRQLSRGLTRHYESFVAPTGLRNTQYALLSHVVKLGPLRLGELAQAMGLEASTLTRNLQPLLDKGLARVSVGSDARSRVVQATAPGAALREQAQRAWKRAQLALNERLGVQRVMALHSLIDECRELLAQGDAGHE
jgi:DNA-binding MarR family transcriptional regulator